MFSRPKTDARSLAPTILDSQHEQCLPQSMLCDGRIAHNKTKMKAGAVEFLLRCPSYYLAIAHSEPWQAGKPSIIFASVPTEVFSPVVVYRTLSQEGSKVDCCWLQEASASSRTHTANIVGNCGRLHARVLVLPSGKPPLRRAPTGTDMQAWCRFVGDLLQCRETTAQPASVPRGPSCSLRVQL